jgi:hypothetical protein
MKLRITLATLAIFLATTSVARADLVTPALWAATDQALLLRITNITDDPVDVVVRFYRFDGGESTGGNLGGEVTTIPPRGTAEFILRDPEREVNGHFRVQTPGRKSGRLIRLTYAITDFEGANVQAAIGRP